jgi:hypothetical protein
VRRAGIEKRLLTWRLPGGTLDVHPVAGARRRPAPLTDQGAFGRIPEGLGSYGLADAGMGYYRENVMHHRLGLLK